MTAADSDRAARIGSRRRRKFSSQNNLTTRDYLIGVPALRMALMAAQGADCAEHRRIAGECGVRQKRISLSSNRKWTAADGIRR
jgi:hypothetical protein